MHKYNSTVLVWNDDGHVRIYCIPPNVYEEYEVYFKEAAGKNIELHSNNNGMNFLRAAVSSPSQNNKEYFTETLKSEKWLKFLGLFDKYLVDSSSIVKGDFHQVIVANCYGRSLAHKC